MRKPVRIDMQRAGCLAKWVKERALYLDTCHRVSVARDGSLVGLKGDIAKIASHVVALSEAAEVELGLAASPEEAAALGYLASLA